MEAILEQLESLIEQIRALPDAGNSIHLRWNIYKLLQAQKSDGDCAIYKELRCSIHLGLVGENGSPVTLSCGHTYCRSCIAPIFHTHYPKCPDCRADILSHDLKDNIAIKAIVDRLLPRHA